MTTTSNRPVTDKTGYFLSKLKHIRPRRAMWFKVSPRSFTAEAITTADNNCPDNVFEYTFELAGNTKVLVFRVEGYTKDSPPQKGKFTTCLNDPTGDVRIIADAVVAGPGGWGNLTLSFNKAAVTTTPIAFKPLPGGHLAIDQIVNIPL